ncbi:MAG: hypothetical protein BWX89_00246 [candidate division TA06 bacterium ADurb.Bin131]|uniref:N-acetyltransferase domain-containing protein n=1 Tax=candidate division TA06 bacterium ADurb.Bin131 TaxID=1852827 RepID=A0A1V6CDZ8_UNCT6|nr:MAG: hypothetical protein BWX89_00246 [candidate division TA06 bacterium ADurb.Bin131]
MVKIENPSRKEFDKVMQFLEESYDHSKGFFWLNYPQVLSKETIDYDNIFIIREGNRIASLVGIYPQKLFINDRTTTIGGIGSVSTHPDFRNKGYMKTLMDFCIDEMKKRKYSFSILGGDRQRYNFWGYETCGSNLVLTFTQRSFEKSGITEIVPIFRYDGSEQIIEEIKQAHIELPCYIERSNSWFQKVFNEKIHTQVYYTKSKNGFAYAIITGERIERKIVEIGGEKNLWSPMVYSLLKRWNMNIVDLYFPSNIQESSILFKHAGGFRIEPFFMVKILSFEDTIACLFGRDIQCDCLLKVSETKQLYGNPDKNKKLIEFDEKKWVRVFFGPLINEVPDCLKKYIPSQFYWWLLDHI